MDKEKIVINNYGGVVNIGQPLNNNTFSGTPTIEVNNFGGKVNYTSSSNSFLTNLQTLILSLMLATATSLSVEPDTGLNSLSTTSLQANTSTSASFCVDINRQANDIKVQEEYREEIQMRVDLKILEERRHSHIQFLVERRYLK